MIVAPALFNSTTPSRILFLDCWILTVYGKPMINEYMGRTTPQIQIEDINIEDPLIAF